MLEFIQSADWSILHWIQENLRCGALDALLPKLTLLGEAGAIWIAVAIGLLLTKKYRNYSRRCFIATKSLIVSYIRC